MKLFDLPNNVDLKSILLEIPDDCKQLYDEKLDKGYFAGMHANGINLFVAKEEIASQRQIFPLYPSENNPLRNWNVISYKLKETLSK